MNIAFDAKRVYQNATGLGNYSRTLVSSLATYYTQHQYYLCAPKITARFNAAAFANVHTLTPQTFPGSSVKSLWRSKLVKKDLVGNNIQLYHGLSHEIPVGIQATGITSVVTIHDLIFERYPKQYNWLDVQIYRKKFKYACTNANRVIAISKQTKDDIVNLYHIPSDKIDVCYQSCDPSFGNVVSEHEKLRVKKEYKLPDAFFLYVGSIIERKNLLNICKALHALKDKLSIPLVVIGEGGSYKQQVMQYCKEHQLQEQVIFLADDPQIKSYVGYQTAKDFPAIYQQATALIYPSIYEGFGIPVLEALWSRLPVITSNVSCMPETGGDAAYYIDPYKVQEMANAMVDVAKNKELGQQMIAKGLEHAQNFTAQKCAASVMEVYLRLR